MSGDRFDEIVAAALQSHDWRAVASIMYGNGVFASIVATAQIYLDGDAGTPKVDMSINLGGCRAAGFEDIGGALSIARWRPNKPLNVLDLLRQSTDPYIDRFYKAGAPRGTDSGLPDRLKSGPHSGLLDAARHHNATRYDEQVMEPDHHITQES